MKTIKKILLGTLILGSMQLAAQPNMEESLKKSHLMLDSAKTFDEVMKASSSFDLNAMKWGKEYITNYYAAYSKCIVSYMEPDVKRKDLVLDQAEKFFEKAKALQPESDETYVLAAMMANARMAVDGANRWQKYGAIFNTNLDKAKEINPNNPRIYYLKGISTFYTPQMFGGGAKNALPYFEKAKECYDKEDKSSVLKPIWGSNETEMYIKKCNE